jgi:hypothetical protein
MVRMYVRHEVDDYTKWRKGYDDFDQKRTEMGVRSHGVYRSVDDANDVTAYHDFDSIDAARSFAESADLKDAMQNAGVASAPQIWFVEEA